MVDPLLPGVSLTDSPPPWRILQQDNGLAALELAGLARVAATSWRVEVRLVRQADGRPVTAALDWQPAATPGEVWAHRLRAIPAGGLYRLETRATRDDGPDRRPTRGDYVHHLGVGDLWVIAGQSNASGTGLGPVVDPPELGVHLFGNDETWQLATHPLEDATHTLHPLTVHGVFQAHSPWLAFARRLRAALGYPIGLLPTALGGSPLAMWEPARRGLLYANLLSLVRAAGGRVRGVVWYQGESDALAGQVADYLPRFAAFVAALRADLQDPALPLVTCQLARYLAPHGPSQAAAWTALREAQRRAAEELPGVCLVPTIDLPLSDEVHLSSAANVALGERCAEAALAAVYGHDRPAVAVTVDGLQWLPGDPPRLRLTCAVGPSGWNRCHRIGDFSLVDAAGSIALTVQTPDDRGWVELLPARRPAADAVLHVHAGCDPPADLRDAAQRPLLGGSYPLPPC
ncbi:MAG: sialate O-acetylesterase [Fimbriimonadaceae bacterium]|nr:sialate O-acetylesterase [Fimbriimonadaceae bacterium]